MLLYGQYNERIIAFDPLMTILINSGFIVLSVILIHLKYVHTIFPLLMFIFSIILCHLGDTLTKIYQVVIPKLEHYVDISYCLNICTFLLWYIGSFLLILNVIISYTHFAIILSFLVTSMYGLALFVYFYSLSNLKSSHLVSPRTSPSVFGMPVSAFGTSLITPNLFLNMPTNNLPRTTNASASNTTANLLSTGLSTPFSGASNRTNTQSNQTSNRNSTQPNKLGASYRAARARAPIPV